MVVVVITLDRRFFDSTVHPLNLAIGPGMIDLSQAMINACSLHSLVKICSKAKRSRLRLVN